MRSKILWPALIIAAVLVGASIPLYFNSTFYYIDDSQSGGFGQWYQIGNRILAGDWSVLNPLVWQAGNYLAEGAWGIFSPVLWVVGLGSHLMASAVDYMIVVKFTFLEIAALGIYALARSFGALRPWAAMAAVATPLAGFTLYMDAASWVNGLMAWALLPLAWVLVRRAVFSGKSPLLAGAGIMAVIGIAYVHATLFLGIVLAATILEAALLRHKSTILRACAIAVAGGFFAIIVHLPGLLTAPVTGRAGGVTNTGLLTANLSGLVASSTPVGTPSIKYFSADFPYAPVLYISWLLPLFAFVNWHALGRLLRQRLSIVVVLGAGLVIILLPSNFGPLRFPIRVMPYIALAVMLILAVGLSLARAKPVSRRRFVLAAAYVLFSSFLTFSQGTLYVKVLLICLVVSLVGVWLIYRALSPKGFPGLGNDESGRLRKRAPAVVAIFGILVTVGFIVPQHATSTHSPLLDYNIPHDVADYQTQLTGAVGNVLVVGSISPGKANSQIWHETLVGNLWYVTGDQVQNAYSAVYYPPYDGATCMTYNGYTCPALYTKLFTAQPQTGKTLVDLLGVSTVQVQKQNVSETIWSKVPAGWHIVQDTAITRLIVRDQPVPGAGGVVWSSPGTKVSVVHEDAMGVSFRIDKVGEDGGTVALSRIPWPGYRIDGGTMTSPVEGLLAGIHVDSSSAGQVVTVSYWEPGWQIELASGFLIVILLLGWALLRRFAGQGAAAGSSRIHRWSVASRSRVRDEA